MNKKFRKAIQDSYVSLEAKKKDTFFAEIENLSSSESREKRLPVFYRFAAGAAGLAAALCVGVYLKNMPVPPVVPSPDDIIVSETVTAVSPTSPAVTEKPEKKTERHTSAVQTETGTSGNTFTTAADGIRTAAAASQTKNGAGVSGTGNITAASPTAVNIDNTIGTQTAVPASDYEYEGSLIVKKYTAFITSVLMLSNATSVNASAQNYEPYIDDLEQKLIIEDYVEKNGEDCLDLNSDGTFDIFDLYAFYRIENSSYGGTIPENIKAKYDALPETPIEVTYTEYSVYEYLSRSGGEEKTYTASDFKPCFYYLSTYFFADKPVKAEYFDTNFYIDNCPDDYNDEIPLELIRHEDGVWDNFTFRKTMYYLKDEDGQYRPIGKDDLEVYDKGYDENFGNYIRVTPLEKLEPYAVSPLHKFIAYSRERLHYSGSGCFLMKDLVEGGYVDADVNSDGVFDFADVALISYYYCSAYDLRCDGFLSKIADPEFERGITVRSNSPVTESEMEKIIAFYEKSAAYLYPFDKYIAEALAEYCVLYKETDPKYFDYDYYDEKGLDFYRRSPVLEDLAGYEEISIKYGPGFPGSGEEPGELPERLNFTKEDINTAFTGYYKNVKTGVLPEPDIDLDGKITDADFNILYNLECEFRIPYDTEYISKMIRRYPVLTPVIDVPQEIRDNFEKNSDINSNGISGDLLDTECMLMYLYGELDKNYSDPNGFMLAQAEYYAAHPDTQYYAVFNKNHSTFNRKHGKGYSGYVSPDEEINRIREYIGTYNSPVITEETTEAPVITAETTAAPVITGETTAATVITGDANLDKKVNVADSVAILQYISNRTKYPLTAQGAANADCDGVKGITGGDASVIQKIDAGIISAQ